MAQIYLNYLSMAYQVPKYCSSHHLWFQSVFDMLAWAAKQRDAWSVEDRKDYDSWRHIFCLGHCLLKLSQQDYRKNQVTWLFLQNMNVLWLLVRNAANFSNFVEISINSVKVYVLFVYARYQTYSSFSTDEIQDSRV